MKSVEFSDEHLLKLFESRFAFFMICERDGGIRYMNPGTKKFFGISRGKGTGENLLKEAPKKISAPVWEIASGALKSKKTVGRELLIPVSGKEKWFEVTATPVHDKVIRADVVMLTGRDITECKITGEKLSESRLQIDILLDGSPVPMFTIDKNHTLIYWNRALERQSGIKAEAALGTKLQWKIFYPKKRPTLADLLLDEAQKDFGKWYQDKPEQSKEIPGSYEIDNYYPELAPGGKWLKLIASALKNDEGVIYGAIETYIDITAKKRAEIELEASRNKYLGYIDNSPNGFFVCDNEGNFIEVNYAAAKLLGYNKKELLKMNFSQIVPPVDLQERLKDFNDFLVKKKLDEELRLLKKNGEILDVIVRAAILSDGTLMAFTTDITESKRKNKLILEKEKIFRLLFENMSEGFALHKLAFEDGAAVDYIITDVNESFESILGFKKEEAIGTLATELLNINRPPPYFEIYKEVAISGIPQHFEVYYAPMKKYFSISVFSPKRNSFAVVFSDVTSIKTNEIALKESEEKLREVFNNANDMIVLVGISENQSRKIIEINRHAIDVLGYEKYELMRMDPVILVDEPDRQKIIEIHKKLDNVPEFSFELNLKTKEGSIIPVEIKTRSFELGGQPVALSVMRDITERKKARDIEKKAFGQIEENIHQLATLGDAIRNPLAVIVGLADLNEGELSDKIKKEAKEIDDYITMLDRGWIESEKIRDFLKRYYDIK
jgi:PAS domain S-box-containing protein